jgi:hypothetical protein
MDKKSSSETPQQLRKEIQLELERMEETVAEIDALRRELGSQVPEMRGRAAAAKFMEDLYMGIENVLKRIVKFQGEELPTGERWHVELFEQFCAPGTSSFPVFFEDRWVERTDSFRRFRHVTHHGYAHDLQWERMRAGLREARPVFDHFRDQVEAFLDDLRDEEA